MTCLITGCTLVNGSARVGGDLHEVGGAYVFNACLLDGREANWVHDNFYAHYSKEIDVSACPYLWERRGVIVFNKHQAVLNYEAAMYIQQWS